MYAAAFSTPETISLERNIDESELDENINLNDLWTENNRNRVKNWLSENSYKNICLQFPDIYLKYSTKICDDLKNNNKGTNFFILADTSYGSCCVDEIAAKHINADGLIHFGNACMSKISRLPVLHVFPQLAFDLDDFAEKLKTIPKTTNLSLIFGISYQYILDNNDLRCEIKTLFPKDQKIVFYKYPGDKIDLNPTNNDPQSIHIYIGRDNNNFFNLSMTIKVFHWLLYDPNQQTLNSMHPMKTNYIRRRYYYIEKCKDAKSLGLVVATLTTDGYLDVVKHMQEMARARNIRTYIISVGRINPAKLANFMEIDCFILIGCPFNNLYTSKEFYKPIISIFEAEMALNPAWHMKLPENYVTDFHELLPNGQYYEQFKSEDIILNENDVSLITGKIRNVTSITTEVISDINNSLVERRNYEIMQQNDGIQFEDRTWQGLDPKLGETEPVKITKGLSGIPIRYTDA